MSSPIVETSSIGTTRLATSKDKSVQVNSAPADASSEEQDEPLLPGLVGVLRPLHEKGRPETHLVAHGYISRGGAKRGSALVTDDKSLMRVRFMW